MNHPFFVTATARTEALRLLRCAADFLASYALVASKSLATRALEFDPTLTEAERLLAVVDTLLAGDKRIANNLPDWYGILQLTRHQGGDLELIANQYRRMVLLLNPRRNQFRYVEQAFRLVFEAWTVLSDPLRKSLYDNELDFHSQQNCFIPPGGGDGGLSGGAQPQLHGSESSGVGGSHFAQVPVQPQVVLEPQNFVSFNSGLNFEFGSGSGVKSGCELVNNNVDSASGVNLEELNNLQEELRNYTNVDDETNHDHEVNVNVDDNVEETVGVEKDKVGVEVKNERVDSSVLEERVDSPVVGDGDGLSFWTACPYCFYMYEYPKVYVDCALRCQNCKNAFEGVVIPSPPPPLVDGQNSYYCWGYLPFGLSKEIFEKHNAGCSGWSPFSPLVPWLPVGNHVNEGVYGSAAPKVNVRDDKDYVEIYDSSETEDDLQVDRGKKQKNKGNNVVGNGAIVMLDGENANVDEALVSPQGVELPNKETSEPSNKEPEANAGKQPSKIREDLWQLDLNVEISYDTEDPALVWTSQVNGSGHAVDENVEGNGFFEGLDEYLSTLPIVAGDNKVKPEK